jgi:hypothetical protein
MLPRRVRIAPLLCLLIGATAQAQNADEASLAAKRSRSPVDPQLAAFAAAPGPSLRRAAVADHWPLLVRADGIVVNAASNGDPKALLAELEAIGLRDGAVAGNAVSGVLPFAAIEALGSLRHLAAARPAMASTSAVSRGLVTSQGVAAMRADRLPRGVDGAGASIGILADSFDCVGGGRAQDTATGDLPADIAILDDSYAGTCSDEGRALAQVAHDVAPRSRLGFHTGFNGQADFAEGVRELARDFAADVITDDVIYFDEPFFQDGVIGRAVSEVHDQGVAYFSAAGNAAHRAYEAPFRDSGQTGFYQELGETRRHDFDPGPGVDVFQTVTVPPFSRSVLVLQWAEPFASASTVQPPVGAASDYDLFVYNTDHPRPGEFADVYARSDSFNPGGDALEALPLRNPGPTPLTLYIAIERFKLPGFDGPDVDRMKLVDYGAGLSFEWSTGGGGTAFGHANARGAFAVGAAAWFETPRFGVSPPLVEIYSSAGGIPILFDGAGNRLAHPIVRRTPDFVAPDGGNTTFFAAPGDVPEDDDAFPNFFGTSAAAPHAAGVAALLQGAAGGGAAITDASGALRGVWMCGAHARHPRTLPVRPERVGDFLGAGATLGPCWKLGPDRIGRVLATSAVDMAAPGYDLDTGYGLVDAKAALRALFRLQQGRKEM